MKKSLLLSIAASAVVFAGGDIAPVQPVQPTAAPAACDFWGTLALRYDANKKEASADEFFGDDDKGALALVMGVEKELGYGFGFGAELAGMITVDHKFNKTAETAELSQLYLTYKVGNTAIKAGRQALPRAVSPLAWSDRTAGVLDRAYNGVVVVNTDIADTTLVGAWVRSVTDDSSSIKLGKNGLFMLGAINKSIANTTLSFAGYYAKGKATAAVFQNNYLSVWAAAQTKVSGADLGLQVAYAKEKTKTKSFGVAGYVGTNFNGLDAKLTLAYLNDGTTSLNYGTTSGFWGGTFGGVFGGSTNGANAQKIARLDLGYKIDGYGKVYAGVAVDKHGSQTEKAARVGYDFKLLDMNAKVEYRYHDNDAGAINHRIRVQGVYKF
jgi:hypothetical protein